VVLLHQQLDSRQLAEDVFVQPLLFEVVFDQPSD
jgi:hypothetical protein